MARALPTPVVEDFDFSRAGALEGLLGEFARTGGFTSTSLQDGIDVLRAMTRDGARVLLSFPAAIVATGVRGVLVELVRKKLVHGIITTCGTLDHDLARTWGAYHHGSFQLDDAELWKKGIHRLGSVLVPRASYGELLEKRLAPLLARLFERGKSVSTRRLSDFLGESLSAEAHRESSLLYHAHRQQVPIFVPGPTDGAVGSQVWMRYQQDRSIRFDLLRDEQDLSDFVHGAKKLGGLIVGGGISKHHLIWWAQFRGGLDYAVALTTAPEYDGSLSGARLREAISWGKLKQKARHVTIDGEATLVLPLLAAGWMSAGQAARPVGNPAGVSRRGKS